MRRQYIYMACAMAGLMGAGIALEVSPARAEGAQAFPDFTFKTVKPPKRGQKPRGGKRITVQIDPAEQARRLALGEREDPKKAQSAKAGDKAGDKGAAKGGAATPAPTGQYAWFWDGISPNLSAGGPGRLEKALNLIGKPPSGAAVRAPRLQGLQDIARARGVDILRATVGTEVSPALVLAVIAVESGGRVDAVSGAGATGLMQLMPATATRFGVKDAKNAGQNIKGGVKFLDHLMKSFDRDPILVLAGYNAGEGAVKKNGGVPDYPETRDYVPKVLAAYHAARGLCATPPQLITDGCVFNVNLAGAKVKSTAHVGGRAGKGG